MIYLLKSPLMGLSIFESASYAFPPTLTIFYQAIIIFTIYTEAMPNRDTILRGQRIIILLNDCFWYGHQGCGQASASVPDAGPWPRRIGRIRRMNRNLWGRLTANGWTVIINWKCEMPGHAQNNPGRMQFPQFLIILLKETARLRLLLLK
jgi:G:T-mismatch repair DNA endonuclease (very short patch repair protein)